MRIFNFIPNLSGGGAERQLSYLASELACMGHDVRIAYLKDGPNKPVLDGVVLYKLKARSNYDPLILWQLFRLVRNIKPDIIHTWMLQMDILGGIIARLNRIPWVFREQTSTKAYDGTWKHHLRVIVGSFASAVISNSQGGDDYWKTQLTKSRRYIISNGLPLSEIHNVLPNLPYSLTDIEAPIVLYVGRTIGSKNPRTFIEVIANIKKRQKVIGILCGDGPNRNELETLRHNLNLDKNVHFTGYLPPTHVWALMKKASVFVSLSAYEGCPNSIMEAMVCGCPLVISDIPAHHEILDENCALFIDPSNIQQVANNILFTLNDAKASNKRVYEAKRKTYIWSISEMARKYEDVYIAFV